MVKKILSSVFGAIFFSTIMPAALAGGPVEEVITDMGEEMPILEDAYYGYGYTPTSINFSVYLTSSAVPDEINISGDYSVIDAVSRADATTKLKKALNDAKKKLLTYGSVVMVSMSVYENYPYDYYGETTTETTYSGYLNISLKLSDFAAIDIAKEDMMELGFNTWTDIVLNEEDKIEIESSLATSLSSLIQKRKKVYEKILDQDLGKIISLYLDTWPDSSKFDPITGKVPVTVTASVGYALN